MNKKVQKPIKYYKTPLEPVLIPGTCLYQVKFESKKGIIPKQLNGIFTKKELAQKEIDRFLSKFQVEYINEQ